MGKVWSIEGLEWNHQLVPVLVNSFLKYNSHWLSRTYGLVNPSNWFTPLISWYIELVKSHNIMQYSFIIHAPQHLMMQTNVILHVEQLEYIWNMSSMWKLYIFIFFWSKNGKRMVIVSLIKLQFLLRNWNTVGRNPSFPHIYIYIYVCVCVILNIKGLLALYFTKTSLERETSIVFSWFFHSTSISVNKYFKSVHLDTWFSYRFKRPT